MFGKDADYDSRLEFHCLFDGGLARASIEMSAIAIRRREGVVPAAEIFLTKSAHSRLIDGIVSEIAFFDTTPTLSDFLGLSS